MALENGEDPAEAPGFSGFSEPLNGRLQRKEIYGFYETDH